MTERDTGMRDEHYDIVSVLYHALQGAEHCRGYMLDAENEGDETLGQFFREAQAAQRDIAEKAKQLLAERFK